MNERLQRLVVEAEDIFKAPTADELVQRNLEALGATRNADGTYDTHGNVVIPKDLVKDGKLLVQFNKAHGRFICEHIFLTTLEGCPRIVEDLFECSDNQLKDLKGGPVETGDFTCMYNNLRSLEGAPKIVHGAFDCSANTLIDLVGGPEEVEGNYSCSSCKLRSLEGAPKKVPGTFACYMNRLTSLEGAPAEVGKDFICSGNYKKFSVEAVLAVSNVQGRILK